MPKRSLVPATRPPSALAPTDLRERLLKLAGLDETKMAGLVKLTVEQAEAALTGAMAVQDPALPDWFARLQAAKYIRDLLGVAPSKVGVGAGSAQVQVNIELPAWAKPKAEVIDVGRADRTA